VAWHTPEDAGDWPWPVWESDTFDKPHKPGKDWAKLVVFWAMNLFLLVGARQVIVLITSGDQRYVLTDVKAIHDFPAGGLPGVRIEREGDDSPPSRLLPDKDRIEIIG
jgi:hypothetical protein